MCFETKTKPAAETKSTPATVAVLGFKTGDLVKILRTPTTADKAGWANSWNVKMDAAIGKTGTVVDDYGTTGIVVNVPGIADRNYYYPKSILESASSTNLIATTDPTKLSVDPVLASKFKVGNKVRAHFPDYGSHREGKIATVVPSLDPRYVRVKFEDGTANLFPQRLTLVEAQATITSEATPTPTPVPSAETVKKSQGIAGAVKSHSAVFSTALNIAKQLGKTSPTVNADQVQDKLAQLGYKSTDLGNAAGALFRGKSWKKVGTTKSARTGNHSREITNWQYIGA